MNGSGCGSTLLPARIQVFPRPNSSRLNPDEHLVLAGMRPGDIFERDDVRRAKVVDQTCFHASASMRAE